MTDEQHLHYASDFLNALAHPTLIRIFSLLSQHGELTPTDLQSHVDMAKSGQGR